MRHPPMATAASRTRRIMSKARSEKPRAPMLYGTSIQKPSRNRGAHSYRCPPLTAARMLVSAARVMATTAIVSSSMKWSTLPPGLVVVVGVPRQLPNISSYPAGRAVADEAAQGRVEFDDEIDRGGDAERGRLERESRAPFPPRRARRSDRRRRFWRERSCR